MIVHSQAGAGALGEAARERTGWIALALVAGAALPVQGAVNAQLNDELDAAIAVGAFSFLIATAAMALALGWILAGGAARPQLAPLRGVPWWGWLGGLCGATYVTAVFSLIPEIGASAVVVLTVAGQQLNPSPWTGTGSCVSLAVRSPSAACSASRFCSPASL